jgi:hypothetical protein
MQLTALTSHSPIGPYVVVAVVGLVTQAVTAVAMFACVSVTTPSETARIVLTSMTRYTGGIIILNFNFKTVARVEVSLAWGETRFGSYSTRQT